MTGRIISALGSQRRTKGKEAAEELGVSCPKHTKSSQNSPPHLTWRLLLLLGYRRGMLRGDWDAKSALITQNAETWAWDRGLGLPSHTHMALEAPS